MVYHPQGTNPNKFNTLVNYMTPSAVPSFLSGTKYTEISTQFPPQELGSKDYESESAVDFVITIQCCLDDDTWFNRCY